MTESLIWWNRSNKCPMSDLSPLGRGRLVGVAGTVVQVSEVKSSPKRGRRGGLSLMPMTWAGILSSLVSSGTRQVPSSGIWTEVLLLGGYPLSLVWVMFL